jgi:hypothetical protein
VAGQAGAALAGITPPVARFTVADDEGATRLLAALLNAGVRVIEASPEGGRLERLFDAPAPGAAAGPAGSPAASFMPPGETR